MKHDEIETMLGAYALDAVDRDEAEAVERHLVDCPRCREEVQMHRETAALLANAGADAPDALWDAMLDRLEDAPPPLRLLPAGEGPRRVTWASRLPAMALGAAAAVALILGITVFQQMGDLRGKVADDGMTQALIAAQAEPGARKVELVSADGQRTAHVVVGPDGNGFIFKHNLLELPEGQVYQLWGTAQLQTMSLGVLGRDPEIVPFKVDVESLEGFAITAEKSPGVAQSSQPFVVSGLVAKA